MGAEPFEAAVQAVHVHARAGDLAATAVGEHAMVATDLLANLPAALAEICEQSPHRSKAAGSRRRRGHAE
jgi:hypothetical protein